MDRPGCTQLGLFRIKGHSLAASVVHDKNFPFLGRLDSDLGDEWVLKEMALFHEWLGL